MRKSAVVFALLLLSLSGCSLLGGYLLKVHNEHIQQVRLTAIQKDTTTVTPINKSKLDMRVIPISIVIPRLNVQAPIQPVGLDRKGRMATIPNAKTIAWYAYGASPGNNGNAILAGHRDWNGVLGTFWGIENLKVNDTVCITFSNESESTFKVVSDNTYQEQDVPPQVMDLSGPTRTTLITCAGDFIRSQGGYQSRVVVVLQKIDQ